MAREDLVFLTKENEKKIQEIAENRRLKVKCPTCGFDSFGPHDCPAVNPS